MQPDARSLERLVPEELEAADVTGRETLELHLARYEFAAERARPGRLLDMACGVGYGARLLADRVAGAAEVVGVDRSAEAVRYAAERYGRPGLRFAVGDALDFEDADGFDTVVSLETVEHVPDPERLIGRLVAALRPGGVLVASVPTTPSADVNPHHLHDFTERSFRRMLARRGLVELDCLRQIQPYQLLATLGRSEARMREMRPNLLGYYALHPVAALRRLAATARFGFTNRYLTVACRRP
jgi:2-polyprenyl-3-methyl-5-hydroxy-6-metoxy-1,4-benzoquinol methylase